MMTGVMLYTIYDVVADEFGPVYQAKNDGVAIRAYRHLVTAQQCAPSDYRLYCIGRFDHSVGCRQRLVAEDPMREVNVARGMEVITNEE